ncbi:MAG: threonine synthase [Tenuifilum sp.]|uniref:threonine synthase n=1 Tax=Tenuifilum sp. TaxID=2760880 RepID=UPI001B6AEC51|nr:threonine synthase [Bacteroidales bacterium]HOK60818.1 threonine synthase [Tenuifilum sp.]MBP9029009.1 threonine synthase [Bacteroidales bacterium]HOK86255.1 threonine synthase [Tenuifilum sp.]HON69967.1 threonine synthase [Tenuifilum sp.]
MNGKFILTCSGCGKTFAPSPELYLCPDCSRNNDTVNPPKGVLKALYNYEILSKHKEEVITGNFWDLIPLLKKESLPKLRVGETPLYRFDRIDGETLTFELYLKDDSQNPTFSFKDRASAVVSAYAKENGISTIVAASTGNAGSSLAGICASQEQKAIIMVPKSAPHAKLTQIVMYGATIVPVNGTYDMAFDLSMEATKEFGWYNRNTAFNPLTIEGKKTVSFELFKQLSRAIPDYIFVPVGDGVIISGVYKGYEDLLKIGLIDRMPTVVAVQAAGSSNLIENIGKPDFTIKPSNTLADSISVDIPRNFFMAQDYLLQYKGEWLSVTDDDIVNASKILARNTGIFAEPAASTAFAGMLCYQKNQKLLTKQRVVVLLTGSGLKDLKAVSSVINIPNAIDPTIDSLRKNEWIKF